MPSPTAVPYNKCSLLSYCLSLLIFIACEEAEENPDSGVPIRVQLRDNYQADSLKLNFAQTRALFSDLLYLAECIKKDSTSQREYQDSLRAVGVMLIMQKYQIDTTQLRMTLDYYLSSIDTGLFLLHSVKQSLRSREAHLGSETLEQKLLSDSVNRKLLDTASELDTTSGLEQQIK